MAQLRGKTVGITTFGGTVDVMTRLIFKSAGLDSNQDVQLLQTGDGGAVRGVAAGPGGGGAGAAASR